MAKFTVDNVTIAGSYSNGSLAPFIKGFNCSAEALDDINHLDQQEWPFGPYNEIFRIDSRFNCMLQFVVSSSWFRHWDSIK